MAPKPAPEHKSKSTGPRTESGKAASSQNALRHGLASNTLLIPGEDPAEYQALEDALIAEHAPTTATETLLVEDMAKHHWLKDRAIRLQGEALAHMTGGELPASFSVLMRYQTTNDRAFHKALATLQALRKQALATPNHFVSQPSFELNFIKPFDTARATERMLAYKEKARKEGRPWQD
jgi:hypothetical protein